MARGIRQVLLTSNYLTPLNTCKAAPYARVPCSCAQPPNTLSLKSDFMCEECVGLRKFRRHIDTEEPQMANVSIIRPQSPAPGIASEEDFSGSGKLPGRNRSDWPLPYRDENDPSEAEDRPMYQYAPLANGLSNIRLVMFQPGAQEIHLKFEHFSVLDHPPYAALSYVWGTQYAPRSIRVGREALQITQNCWYALHQLKQMAAYEWFWIDAISIDQINLEEKSAQISLMGDIYRNAGIVYVSLGTDGVDSEHFFSWLRKLGSGEYRPREFGLDEYRALKGIVEIAYAEYWSRLWICQEFALAKAIVVLRGETSMPWHILRQVMENFANQESRFAVSPDLMGKVPARGREWWKTEPVVPRFDVHMSVWAEHYFRKQELRDSPMRSMIDLKTSHTMLDALRITGSRRCSEIKDRVYGMLDLIEWPSDPMKADYAQSELAIAIQIMSYIFEEHVTTHFERDPLFASISVILRALDLSIGHDQYIQLIQRRRHGSNSGEPEGQRIYAFGKTTCALHEVASWSHIDNNMHVFTCPRGYQYGFHKQKIVGPETDLRAGDILVWDTTPCDGHKYRLHFILRKHHDGPYSLVAYLRRYESAWAPRLGQRIVMFMHHEDLFVWYYLSMISMRALKRGGSRRIGICRANMSSYAMRKEDVLLDGIRGQCQVGVCSRDT